MRFLCPPVLALSETDYPTFVLWILGGIVAAIYAVNAATEIIERYRVKPPANEVFASKKELLSLQEKLDGIAQGKWATRDELREAHGRIDTLTTGMDALVERVTEALKQDMAEHRKETRDLTKSLEAIHRSIGQLEGKIAGRK